MGIIRNYIAWHRNRRDRLSDRIAVGLLRSVEDMDRSRANRRTRLQGISSHYADPASVLYEYRVEKFRRAGGSDVERTLDQLGKKGWEVTTPAAESARQWGGRYAVTLRRPRK